MKLNYRDKVILGIVLALFIIIGGYIGLIKPKRAAIKDNEEKRTEVQDEQDRIERRIATGTQLEKDIEEAQKKASSLGEIFVEKSDIDRTTLLDKFMQEYANKCECEVIELKVDDLAANTLAYYYEQYVDVAPSLRESADINGTLQEKMEADSKEASTIEGRNVETIISTRYGLTVVGTKANVWKYMDMIADYDEAVLITSIGMEKYNEEGDEKKQAAQNNQNNQQQGQNNQQNSDQQRENLEDDTVIKSDIVISLYSIYNMEKPEFKD
ncbi:MAG: hypothetical protein GXY08_05930 [Ruminococcus sp.]|nr:hypothetical protein [Ruminococcus sp.]